jgi:hypothetical protein
VDGTEEIDSCKGAEIFELRDLMEFVRLLIDFEALVRILSAIVAGPFSTLDRDF